MPHTSDTELIQHTHNTARYFVEHRQIAWAALVGVIGWGVYGYFSMPQRKDPEIPVRVAVAACLLPFFVRASGSPRPTAAGARELR